MGIDLADQHVQLRCAQLSLLLLDLLQQPLDIPEQFIVGVTDLVQLCVCVKLYGPIKIAAVKFRHGRPDLLDGLCKSSGEINTQHRSRSQHYKVDPGQHQENREDPLVQNFVRHKRKDRQPAGLIPVRRQNASRNLLPLQDHTGRSAPGDTLRNICLALLTQAEFLRDRGKTELSFGVDNSNRRLACQLSTCPCDPLQKRIIHLEEQHPGLVGVLHAPDIPSDKKRLLLCSKKRILRPEPFRPGVVLSQIVLETAVRHILKGYI